jgi:murein DD-endopeptidase MepM/ murein hydrolase activator NlpD
MDLLTRKRQGIGEAVARLLIETIFRTTVVSPGFLCSLPQNPTPTPSPTPNPNCGVNPVTGQPGFTRNPMGQSGHLRAPVGGQGQFHAPRRGDPIGHKGLDIAGTLNVSPVYANRDGTVSFAGRTAGAGGWMVIINHAGGVETRYAHLQANSIPGGIVTGSQVSEGQQIGILGNTGNAGGTPPHVHFGVNAGRVDPETYLNNPC